MVENLKAKKVKKSSACAVWHGAAAEKSKFTEAKMVCPPAPCRNGYAGIPKGELYKRGKMPYNGIRGGILQGKVIASVSDLAKKLRKLLEKCCIGVVLGVHDRAVPVVRQTGKGGTANG